MPPMITGEVPAEDLLPDAMRTLHNDDWVQCEDCLKYFIWEKIPDEYIVQERVFLGECHGMHYDYEVRGWNCPICGSYNLM